jgi:hypothetical protein
VSLHLPSNSASKKKLVSIWNNFLTMQTELVRLEIAIVPSALDVDTETLLQIPILNKLVHLLLDFKDSEFPLLLRPICPEQFPTLKMLYLGGIKRPDNWLPSEAIWASVNELQFDNYHGEPGFHRNFPNLVKLQFKVFTAVPVIRSILMHYIGIEVLDLGKGCAMSYGVQHALWDLYTGGAPPPPRSQREVLHWMQNIGRGGGDSSQGPSLASLKSEIHY